jgi:DNA-binding response OmpR family regulator
MQHSTESLVMEMTVGPHIKQVIIKQGDRNYKISLADAKRNMEGLTRRERVYLDALIEAPAGLSFEQLAALVPLRTAGGINNLIAVHIMNLNKKLPETQHIESLRSWGYILITK